MMEALGSSEKWGFTRATRRNIPEDSILHSHRRENLKYYWTLRNHRCLLTHDDIALNTAILCKHVLFLF
jgi:hypothetical protein